MADEDEWIVARGVLGFQKPQVRQARESPSCLLHWLALLPLGGEMGQSPLASPLISSLQKAFSCQGKPSEEGRAGPLWPHSPASAETGVPAMGTPPGR